MPPDQVAKVILGTVAKRTASEVGRSEVNRIIKGQLDQIDDSVTDKVKGVLDKLGN